MARMRQVAFLLVLALGLAPSAASADCVDGICVDWETEADETLFLARHELPVPIQVRLRLELRNMAADPADEVVALVPVGEEVTLATIWPEGSGEPRWKYRWRSALGEPDAAHDEAARYRIPFGGKAPRRLTQGGNGGFSHRGRTAYDFRMPVGTPILAARGGVVAKVVDVYTRGGRRRSLAGKANRVMIAHDDGSVALYVHLSKGAVVSTGDRVVAGQRLGLSGNTGYTTGPHLHFEVYAAVSGQVDTESISIRFDDGSPRGTTPVAGSYYGPAEEVAGPLARAEGASALALSPRPGPAGPARP